MRLYVKLLLMFIVTQLLGIYTGTYLLEDIKTNEYAHTLMMVEAGDSAIIYFVLAVLSGAVLFLILSRLHIALLFTLLEMAVVSTTTSIFLYSLLKPALADTLDSMVIAILLALIFALLKQLFHSLKNLAAVTSSAGAGAVFGFTFGFMNAVIFLIILAVYDYISVYKTKHMIQMANEIVDRDMAFTISSQKRLPTGKLSRLDLGTGDISLPIMAEVSAYAISPVLSAFVLGGAVVGTLFVLYVAWKHKTVLPALPPITTGILIFSLLAIFLGYV